ncbi:MAG: bifunctional 5,10-methylenetetrahydrofolate dehydrogenase/5,10-methenyltetrahydrofolate cyclohydrolase [Oscillospiraceae bacterium]|nr:bifunctional 5,10-methylenetetrahydrofolate dehydrogenase/5,10-methenyltetrahydrofolate cyclohydrolase [Oscillospiraceae bacterium]
MALILKGAPVAAALSNELIERAQTLRTQGVVPTLAILRVGEQPDDLAYERGAMKRCARVGVAVEQFVLPADCTRDRFLNTFLHINIRPEIHGFLVLRPLPDPVMEEAACELIKAEKDVDGMSHASLARVFSGYGPGYPPCTAQAVMEILDYYRVPLSGRRAAVLGRSLVAGRPIAMMLMNRDATVTICHSRTEESDAICRAAEIVVAASGRARALDGRYAAPGQTVVDVGINVDADGVLCGDVDFAAVEPTVDAITPVPGGVGAVTTTVLAKHVIEAAEKTL